MVVTTEARAPEAEAAHALAEELRWRIAGEVRFDDYSRALYSTDASNYQIVPLGVVLPRTVDDLRATIELAAKHQTPILPRGGGSSLAGQTVGRAVVSTPPSTSIRSWRSTPRASACASSRGSCWPTSTPSSRSTG